MDLGAVCSITLAVNERLNEACDNATMQIRRRVRDASRGEHAMETDASGSLPRYRVIVPARLLCNTAATSRIVAPPNLP